MTLKTRLFLVAAVAAVPMFSANSAEASKTLASKDAAHKARVQAMKDDGCGDSVPWGLAPCIID